MVGFGWWDVGGEDEQYYTLLVLSCALKDFKVAFGAGRWE